MGLFSKSKSKEAEAAEDAPPSEDWTLPSYSDATGAPPAPALEFHAYAQGGMINQNLTITGADKQRILYFLKHPTSWTGKWDLTLRQQGLDGPEVAKISKKAIKDSFQVVLASDGQLNAVKKSSLWTQKFEFTGNNGTERYTFQPDGRFARIYCWSLYKVSEMELPKEQRKVIAHWRTPDWAVSKNGTLKIQPDHAFEQDLILAVVLGVQLSGSEERTTTAVLAAT
ncbi:hypothetical protein JCM6882_008580 [Rhodosporidiobolus microsporus]